ncbi:16S rRNA (guanine(966)-N(2))-methyltransferase RsmD [Polynucleobacter sp. IMCC 29146]|uniref:16S rRNA (guanine(966)-N(2))-methyltransferase RsmD n=1 Tax=Polynucleobacter sp. IMCC 29146 TaxID=2780953 RepID=UPI001F3DED19|nr:16S rRNA (guanine(966)-N(2))-methyltransferase RsmD [Polynucleobacter sp. IMCC 29146]MCE7529778.1 16S rRNA (guanine(966)-N(2))-methyltransferase RsmD [Polynucleobacter sp. IMCC 29146]
MIKSPRALPQQIRIIGGVWRSRQIKVISQAGLRPSTDRLRETLFNWLGQDLSGLRCLDVFAGSGALGFEAASRNAALVELIEKHKNTFLNLTLNLQNLNSYPAAGKVTLLEADGLQFLKSQAAGSWDLIFLDPPFQEPQLLVDATKEAGRVCQSGPQGAIYIECPVSTAKANLISGLQNWTCVKELAIGQTLALLFRATSG